jgi:hypothetical protein
MIYRSRRYRRDGKLYEQFSIESPPASKTSVWEPTGRNWAAWHTWMLYPEFFSPEWRPIWDK